MQRTDSRLLIAPIQRKAMVAEAMAALALGRILTSLPMRIHVRVFGRAERATPLLLRPEQIEIAIRVGSAVQRAAQVVPFKAVCIEQTLAAHMILRSRAVPTTAYLGVRRDPDKRAPDPDGFNAHTWLRAGDEIIIGGPDVSDYVPLAHFS